MWKNPEKTVKTLASLWFAGVFPVLPVDKPVDNVDNFDAVFPKISHNFLFM